MTKVYKFLRSQDIPFVTEDHTLRLASAEEVRLAEDERAGFGDSNEVRRLWQPQAGLNVLDPDHPFIRHLYGSKPRPSQPVRLIIEEGARFDLNGQTLIFSTAATDDTAMRERMKAEFGYDAVFTIYDLEGVAARIAGALGVPHRVGEVTYRDFDPLEPLDPEGLTGFVKPDRLRWQLERRAIFQEDGPSRVVRVAGLWRFISGMRHY